MSHPLIIVRNRVLSPAECLGGYPTPPGADGLGLGLGLGRRGSGSVWTPASIGGDYLWADLDELGAVSKNAQPVLVDGDAEAAGAGAWSVYNATASKSTSSPYEGTQCLDVNVTGANGSAYQDILVSDNWYLVLGAGQGDGASAAPVAQVADNNTAWTGTVSSSWQSIAGEANSRDPSSPFYHTLFVLRPDGGLTGSVRYDALRIRNQSVTGIDDKGGLADPAQATAAYMPRLSDAEAPTSAQVGGRNVLYFGHGTGLYMPKTPCRFMHDGTGVTFNFIFRVDTWDATVNVILSALTGVSSIGTQIQVSPSGQILFSTYNGTGATVCQALSSAGAVSLGTLYAATIRMDTAHGCDIMLNGTIVASGANLAAPSAADSTNNYKLGNFGSTYTYGLKGLLGSFFAHKSYVSDADQLRLNQFSRSYYGF